MPLTCKATTLVQLRFQVVTRTRDAPHIILIAVVVMCRFPEQLPPVAHLGLDRAEAIAEGREVGDPLWPPGQFEAEVVELSQKLVAAFGRLVHLISIVRRRRASRHWRS